MSEIFLKKMKISRVGTVNQSGIRGGGDVDGISFVVRICDIARDSAYLRDTIPPSNEPPPMCKETSAVIVWPKL